MMALPLLRVALAEPTQNSRLQVGVKPQRPYFLRPSRKVRLRISHSITSTPRRSTTS
jgi:hypothetical protein